MSRLDPVSDPVYNMVQIIKQSILLEDHLVEVNKRCDDCIVKHFLTISALQEEALSLSGTEVYDYPYMLENESFYDELFNLWLSRHNEEEEVCFYIADKLRKRRKDLTKAYIL